MRTSPTVLLLAALLVCAQACAADDATDGEPLTAGPGEVLDLPGGGVVLVADPVDYGMEARVGGVLATVDGCLGLRGPGSADVAIWPAGTTVAEGGDAIVLPDGRRLPVGSRVDDLAGGYVGLPDSAPRPPRSCAERSEYVVVSGFG